MSELPPEVEQATETALDILASERQNTLVKNASKAHIAGDTYASKALKIDIAWDLVQSEALEFAKEYRKEVRAGYTTIKGEKVYWLKDRAKADRERIFKTLETGIKYGQSMADLSKALRAELDVMKSQATRIARTEVARIQNQGTINRYQKHGVQKVKWLVFSPCPICAPFANNIYELSDLPDEIPVHPNCRCSLAPIVEAKPKAEAKKPEAPKSEFVPAKDRDEAEKYAQQFARGKVSYRGLSVDSANEVNRALMDAGVGNKLPKFYSIKANKFKGAIEDAGAATNISNELAINTAVMKDAKTFAAYTKDAEKSREYIKARLASGDLPPDLKVKAERAMSFERGLVGTSRYDFITHEIGHHIDMNMLLKDKELRHAIQASEKTYSVGISSYADTTSLEYIAESYTAYRKGETAILDPKLVKFFDGVMK